MSSTTDHDLPPKPQRSGKLALLLALIVAMLATWAIREIHNVRLGFPEAVPAEDHHWWVSDPDSHYHVRRLWRHLEEPGPVAGVDDYLNHPYGAEIPWPPYYTYFLSWVLGPLAPGPELAVFERRLWLEQAVALVPCALSVLTALILGLATALLIADWKRARGATAAAGPLALAALVAGSELAFYNASVQYSGIGVGDHHAFVTCVTALMFLALMRATAAVRASSRASGWLFGTLAGVLAGILLGAWAGGLMYVLIVQTALGLLLLASGFRKTGGGLGHAALAPTGFAFHLAACLTLLPAALASPWKAESPWMVVNLSWFHPLQLALGALVFVPLLPARTLGTRFARNWPFLVAALLVLLGGGSWLLNIGPAAGIKEGFAWAGRSNQFMDYITESQPLFGRATGGLDVFFKYLGYGGALLPLGWMLMLVRAWRTRESASAVLLVAAPVMFVQALAQRRFADTLVVPLAMLMGWLTFELALALRARLPRLATQAGWRRMTLSAGVALLALGATAAANWKISSDAYQKIFVMKPMQRWARGRGALFQRETRAQLEWLRTHTDKQLEPGAVLAQWERGHVIEWGADRPSVGTNFGIYVGIDSYRDPWRFLLAEDPAEAEQLLIKREARYVQVTAHFGRMVPTMLTVLNPAAAGEFYANSPNGAVCFPRLFDTFGIRLSLDGSHVAPTQEGLITAGPSIDFLRLIHVTDGAYPTAFLPFSPGPFPLGFLWEHVPGAKLFGHGLPGETLEVELEVHYDLERRTHRLTWRGQALVGQDGRALVRVPYTTTAPNGIGAALSSARWSLAERSGRVDIAPEAVLEGLTVELP